MASRIWKGSISFGLVNIPISLQPAVREDHIGFRLLEKGTNCPVKYERVCKKNNKTIPYEKIVKGFEYEKDHFVVLDEEDFNKAALATSKAFEIENFVPLNQIDPRFFDKPYYAVPDEGSESVYALLRKAMDETGMVGIGRITVRQKQHLAAVKPLGDGLEINLMRFVNEIIDEEHYHFPKTAKVKGQALTMAKQLIASLSADFDPSQYADQYRENLEKIIQSKLKGKKIDLEEPAEPKPTGVIDLMERLKQSLEKKEGRTASTKTRATKSRRTTTAKKAKKRRA